MYTVLTANDIKSGRADIVPDIKLLATHHLGKFAYEHSVLLVKHGNKLLQEASVECRRDGASVPLPLVHCNMTRWVYNGCISGDEGNKT